MLSVPPPAVSAPCCDTGGSLSIIRNNCIFLSAGSSSGVSTRRLTPTYLASSRISGASSGVKILKMPPKSPLAGSENPAKSILSPLKFSDSGLLYTSLPILDILDVPIKPDNLASLNLPIFVRLSLDLTVCPVTSFNITAGAASFEYSGVISSKPSMPMTARAKSIFSASRLVSIYLKTSCIFFFSPGSLNVSGIFVHNPKEPPVISRLSTCLLYINADISGLCLALRYE
jgi:hypothetical protein